MAWNVFRVLADLSHLGSICLLIWAIHKNKSAEGKIPLLATDLRGSDQTYEPEMKLETNTLLL